MVQGSDWPTEIAEEASGPAIDMQRVFVGRLWLILLFTIAGGLFGYLQHAKTPPVYRSAARMLVVQNDHALPLDSIGSLTVQKRNPIETHIALMRTPVILERAAEKLNDDRISSFSGRVSIAAIASGLIVQQSDQSDEIIELSYVSANREECEHVLNAVMVGYMDFVGETQQTLSEKTAKLISEAKDDLAEQLREKEETYQEFRDSASLLWNGEKGTNLHQQRLGGIEDQRAGLLIMDSQIRAELDAIQSALERGTPREVLLLVADQTLQRDGNQALDAQSGRQGFAGLLPLMLEEALLLEKLGTGHPKVREVQKKIEITRQLVRDKAGEEPHENAAQKTSPKDLVSLYVESLEEELRVNQQKLKRLDTLFEQERASARQLGNEENRDRALREDIERTKRLFDVVVDQLQEISLVKESGSLSAEVIAPPGPGYQIGPDFNRIMGLGIVAGTLVGIAISFLLEVSDRRFRTPEEVSQRLRLPVLGHVPVLDDGRRVSRATKDDIVHQTLATYHRPKSRISEAYRQVRTSLLFGTKGEHHSVIQVTSPDPGDGKSTLCANVAVALANSGKRVLVIDADLRKPKQHKLFGLENEVGFSSVINGSTEIPDAISDTLVPNLKVLTAGPRTDHPSEILLSPEFDPLLQVVREKYDIVLVDTPPLLVVSDPASLANKMDGIVLVVRINQRSRTHAVQARDSLEMLGANVLGVVVNGVAAASRYSYVSGRYRYGKGGYGYGYGQPYGSRYGEGYYDVAEDQKQGSLAHKSTPSADDR